MFEFFFMAYRPEKCSLTALMRFIHPTNGDRHLNPSAWRATGRHAQGSARCAPPFTPQKAAAAIKKPLRKLAKRTPQRRTTTAYAE